MTTEKTCFKCKALLPIEEFYKHPGMADGHLGKCKACTRKDVRDNRNVYMKRPRIVSDIDKATKRRAAVTLNNALRDGRVKQHECLVCGGKSEAHHPDYSRPLDVVWLCRAHHILAHESF